MHTNDIPYIIGRKTANSVPRSEYVQEVFPTLIINKRRKTQSLRCKRRFAAFLPTTRKEKGSKTKAKRRKDPSPSPPFLLLLLSDPRQYENNTKRELNPSNAFSLES
jgi:hypothetical protein